jgi:RNA polymerase sigma factor (sigma-70 family)
MPTNPAHRHPETNTDRHLLEEARDGCGESFEVVYRRHHAVVLALLVRRVQQPELAADLLAETFASLLTLVRDPQHAVPPIPVARLLVTARNPLIDGHRRGRVDDRARRQLAMQPMVLDDGDLERAEEISAETDLMRELASRLEPDQFQALRARALDEREYPEIAAQLKCSSVASASDFPRPAGSEWP